MSPKGMNRRAGRSKHLENAIDRPVPQPVATPTAMMRLIQSYPGALVSNKGFIRK